MAKIEAVIFDWAGTTVDYGCFAPVQAFKDAFNVYGLEPTNDQIREPMGKLKIDHIKTMLEMPSINQEFKKNYNRNYNNEDVNQIYKLFEKSLMSQIVNHTKIKPYVLETVTKLKEMGIKIGSTTGYTDMMMEPVLNSAKKQGYEPDCWYSPDSTNNIGRPYPYMIFKNMMTLNISNVRNVIKVGDTISDIQEGVNAGVIVVGVVEGSSLLGLNEKEFELLSNYERNRAVERVKEEYLTAGADFVINNLSELLDVIKEVELY
ncbi:phosphonoacetaldehyde hydrolase [Thomasclavelia sp.]